jgi:hypothetical protein
LPNLKIKRLKASLRTNVTTNKPHGKRYFAAMRKISFTLSSSALLAI